MNVHDVAQAHLRRSAGPLSFRAFAESPLYCGLKLSPLMAAIMEASDGDRVRPMVAAHFGGAGGTEGSAGRDRRCPRTVAVRAGARGGKTSRLLAPKALHAALTVPLPTLARGESAAALFVAPDLKLGRQTLSFVKGYVQGSDMLRSMLIGEPTQDAVVLERPDGKRVRIEVLAAGRGGTAVRARTLVFAGLEEAAFFRAEGTSVINDQEIYDAVLPRVVPGGQVWIVSTPWAKGVGLLERLLEAEWGKHERALVCSAGTRHLNPHWDPDGSIEADMRANNPEKARREIDGEPMSGGEVLFFDDAAIMASIDKNLTLPRKPKPREEVCGALDAGFRRNSTAGCVTHRSGRAIIVGDLWERRPEPGQPLKPSVVLNEAAVRFRSHAGCNYVVADGHYREAVAEVLGDHDLAFKDAPSDVSEPYVKTRAMMRDGRLKIPNDAKLVSQLRSVMWRPNSGGSVSILLPQQRTGEHCDLVAVLVLAVWESAGLDVPEPEPVRGSPEWNKRFEDEEERRLIEEIDREEWEAKEERRAWANW